MIIIIYLILHVFYFTTYIELYDFSNILISVINNKNLDYHKKQQQQKWKIWHFRQDQVNS
jgi:hypothetical protein